MPAQVPRITADSVRREQLWAAMVRAVHLLLEDTEADLETQCACAADAGDQERVERLSRRLEMLRSLRKQIEALP